MSFDLPIAFSPRECGGDSRQDALIIAALDAAERRGTPAVIPAGNASWREAYTDAELAALVRRTIQETIS
jgi:hypothetical protein